MEIWVNSNVGFRVLLAASAVGTRGKGCTWASTKAHHDACHRLIHPIQVALDQTAGDRRQGLGIHGVTSVLVWRCAVTGTAGVATSATRIGLGIRRFW